MTNNKRPANKNNTKTRENAPNPEWLKVWLGFIALIVGFFLTFWGIRTQVYLPIIVTQTAEALYLTQTALAQYSIPTPTPPAIFTLTPTLAPTPEPVVNLSKPDKKYLNLLPFIFDDYIDVNRPQLQAYKWVVNRSESYLWTYRWCSKYNGTLKDNLAELKYTFLVDKNPIPESAFLIYYQTSSNNWKCQRWTTMLSQWNRAASSVTLSVIYYIPSPLYDGENNYHPGEYRHDIIISIQ